MCIRLWESDKVHPSYTKFHFTFSLELSEFLKDKLDAWKKEQNSVDKQYLQLMSNTMLVEPKTNSRKKRKSQKNTKRNEDEILSGFAAKLQIELFLKVIILQLIS